MQLRTSTPQPGSHFNGNIVHPIRRSKQQTFFTYKISDSDHKKQQLNPRNVYYDNNPYFLHGNPSEPRIKGVMSTSRHSSHSRDINETSSQRSCKIVRANGLTLVQKPKILREKQEMANQAIQRMAQPNRKLQQHNFQLESENRTLKQENELLRLQMKEFQDVKNRQISKLNQRIDGLNQITVKLEQTINQNEVEWRSFMNQLRHK